MANEGEHFAENPTGQTAFGKAADGRVYPFGVRQDTGEMLVSSLTGQGIVASASFTPTASAYGAGDIMDVAKEMAFVDRNGLAVPAGSLIRILSTMTKIDITAVPSGQTSYTGQLYSVTPPSAQADNDAWTLASGDLTAYRGDVALGTPVDKGAALYIKSQYVDIDIKLGSSSLWMELVTDGAHTAAAVARQILLYGMVI